MLKFVYSIKPVVFLTYLQTSTNSMGKFLNMMSTEKTYTIRYDTPFVVTSIPTSWNICFLSTHMWILWHDIQFLIDLSSNFFLIFPHWSKTKCQREQLVVRRHLYGTPHPPPHPFRIRIFILFSWNTLWFAYIFQ